MMVFGESAKSRRSGQEHRKWCLGADLISETDEQHHLGILRDVYNSTIHRTNERCSAARSAFYSLNSIGTRFGRLHPLTSPPLPSSQSPNPPVWKRDMDTLKIGAALNGEIT